MTVGNIAAAYKRRDTNAIESDGRGVGASALKTVLVRCHRIRLQVPAAVLEGFLVL